MKQLVVSQLYELPDVLKRERTAQKMTQKELADIAHIGINTVALTEQGKTVPSIVMLSNIVKALGYDEIVIKIY